MSMQPIRTRMRAMPQPACRSPVRPIVDPSHALLAARSATHRGIETLGPSCHAVVPNSITIDRYPDPQIRVYCPATMSETFGQVLTSARRKAGLSQREPAARILKEDGEPISPQYLNDLERDRRNPPAQHFLKQLAEQLNLPEEYLDF